MQLPVLIFDYGNVIAYFDYLKFFNRVGARQRRSGEAVQREMMDQGFTSRHARFETGELTPEAFFEGLGLNCSFDEFVRNWEDIFELNEPVAQLIGELKGRGYKLVLGSNTNLLQTRYFLHKFAATLDLFDELVLSYEVGAMKPDRRFYEACVQKAGVAAKGCVFIDDLPLNVDGARRAGLKALQYTDDRTLIADLGRLGVEITGREV